MEGSLAELVWRGIEDANPWWRSGAVPPARLKSFRRDAFETIFAAFKSSDVGRGVVVLGPRRIGKTVLLHQVIEQLLKEGTPPDQLCFLSLDDVALRDRDLGELLALVEVRRPAGGRPRLLVLDEVQHSKDWAGWLKRIADRGDPYTFLATGSSATALKRGGQDAGLGRWREMTLFPWSFREHVRIRDLDTWSFKAFDNFASLYRRSPSDPIAIRPAPEGPPPADESARLEVALIDYFVRGGFPEVATEPNASEARRKLRQDILDRSLGRDVTDAVGNVDTPLLERLFLRICLNPGGLWSEAEAARDLQVSRPTIARYLRILEEAFLVFRFPNLASPIKGQPKVYLVAPAMRQALLSLDENDVRRPDEWGRIAENAVAAAAWGTSPDAVSIGFWRKGDECDVVILTGVLAELVEVKRSGQKAMRGIDRAAAALMRSASTSHLRRWGAILSNNFQISFFNTPETETPVFTKPVAEWLYSRDAHSGGTLRIRP